MTSSITKHSPAQATGSSGGRYVPDSLALNLTVRNDSRYKGMFRRDDLLWLAERVCAGERAAERLGDAAELSVLFCDDPFIAELNRTYRHVDDPTDVLSFGPSPEIKTAPGKPAVLGDIVVSLETVERRCGGDRAAMRKEIRLLLCHGLLHLLGSQHDTAGAQTRMAAKQAQYLGMEVNAAWGRPVAASRTRRNG